MHSQCHLQDFVDERDSGVIYVTHFTLLLGLAIPMWLSVGLPGIQALVGSSQQLQEHQQQQQPLQQACTSSTSSSTSSMCASNELAAADCSRLLLVMAGLSGMVIIGVGDTAASAVGKLWGRVPIYKGSRKTVEGMVAGVASSLGAWCLLLWCAGLRGGSMGWWLQLVLVTTGAGLMEACTSQLDNILLPLWYLPHLMLVQC
jgi:dolichol kinase